MSEMTYMPTVMAVEEDGVMRVRQKEGHKCCGCCCDTRRAVISVNAVSAIWMAIGTILLFVGIEFLEAAAATADDDEIKEVGAELQQIPVGLLVFLNAALIGLYCAGIKGAVDYNPTLVKCAMFAYCAKIAIDLFNLAFINIVIDGFFLYPHVMFLKEMKENIMTPENYPNEAHCCC